MPPRILARGKFRLEGEPASRREIVISAGGSSFVVGDDDDRISFLSLVEALEGNTERLMARKRSGETLSQNEKNFLAGLIKRPAHRLPKQSTYVRHSQIAWLVHYCEHAGKWQREPAVAKAMEVFKVSRRAVFNALKEVEKEWGRAGRAALERDMLDEGFSKDRLKAPDLWAEVSITWSKEEET